jgi:hypothetical protein
MDLDARKMDAHPPVVVEGYAGSTVEDHDVQLMDVIQVPKRENSV